MTYDDIPFDYEDDRQLLSDEEEQYIDDCNERADDMRQEIGSIY
jgi:ribosome assembly protein YihI (activator of Der GTPase)